MIDLERLAEPMIGEHCAAELFGEDRITWTGHARDTVLFAILKEEWPV